VEVLTAVNVGGCFGFYGDLYSHAACFAGGTGGEVAIEIKASTDIHGSQNLHRYASGTAFSQAGIVASPA
jgi:hypothetical protein